MLVELELPYEGALCVAGGVSELVEIEVPTAEETELLELYDVACV